MVWRQRKNLLVTIFTTCMKVCLKKLILPFLVENIYIAPVNKTVSKVEVLDNKLIFWWYLSKINLFKSMSNGDIPWMQHKICIYITLVQFCIIHVYLHHLIEAYINRNCLNIYKDIDSIYLLGFILNKILTSSLNS